ncbi:MAG TPA: MerR family transcriptional regulator [Steroidobacter sp.]|nr:MerR family transcriptional regulator [Steroidobacter sp.]
MSMHTVGRLAKQFGLSRSTLLYYDRIGLLRPSGRSGGNYRLYTEKDVAALSQIALYREAGLALGEIAKIIGGKSCNRAATATLEKRLRQINGEIAALRNQQQIILRLIEHDRGAKRTRIVTKESWTVLLKAAGLSEDDMRKWHVEFERAMPEAHQDFLESLGLGAEEIRAIRTWSRAGDGARQGRARGAADSDESLGASGGRSPANWTFAPRA